MADQKPKVIKKSEQKPPHPLYMAFANMKSATLEVARQIAKDSKDNIPPDVQRLLDIYEKKAA